MNVRADIVHSSIFIFRRIWEENVRAENICSAVIYIFISFILKIHKILFLTQRHCIFFTSQANLNIECFSWRYILFFKFYYFLNVIVFFYLSCYFEHRMWQLIIYPLLQVFLISWKFFASGFSSPFGHFKGSCNLYPHLQKLEVKESRQKGEIILLLRY